MALVKTRRWLAQGHGVGNTPARKAQAARGVAAFAADRGAIAPALPDLGKLIQAALTFAAGTPAADECTPRWATQQLLAAFVAGLAGPGREPDYALLQHATTHNDDSAETRRDWRHVTTALCDYASRTYDDNHVAARLRRGVEDLACEATETSRLGDDPVMSALMVLDALGACFEWAQHAAGRAAAPDELAPRIATCIEGAAQRLLDLLQTTVEQAHNNHGSGDGAASPTDCMANSSILLARAADMLLPIRDAGYDATRIAVSRAASRMLQAAAPWATASGCEIAQESVRRASAAHQHTTPRC